MTAHCLKGCGKTWPRDPVLEVACPTCNAPVGRRCKRPSGHGVWGGQPHPARDVLADRCGFYGACPWQCCGLENVTSREGRQLDMFAGAAS